MTNKVKLLANLNTKFHSQKSNMLKCFSLILFSFFCLASPKPPTYSKSNNYGHSKLNLFQFFIGKNNFFFEFLEKIVEIILFGTAGLPGPQGLPGALYQLPYLAPGDAFYPQPVQQSVTRQCENGKVFSECASSCVPTCKDISHGVINTTCTEKCMTGCFCPSGFFVSSKGICVPQEDCECWLDNFAYFPGSYRISITANHSYVYLCKEGKFIAKG